MIHGKITRDGNETFASETETTTLKITIINLHIESQNLIEVKYEGFWTNTANSSYNNM